MIVSGFLAVVQQLVLLGVPLIVQQLLRWLISDSGETYVGVIWAFALCVRAFFPFWMNEYHFRRFLFFFGLFFLAFFSLVVLTKF